MRAPSATQVAALHVPAALVVASTLAPLIVKPDGIAIFAC
jgi:hypothetical protein